MVRHPHGHWGSQQRRHLHAVWPGDGDHHGDIHARFDQIWHGSGHRDRGSYNAGGDAGLQPGTRNVLFCANDYDQRYHGWRDDLLHHQRNRADNEFHDVCWRDQRLLYRDIEAIATATGFTNSAIATAAYTITIPAPTITNIQPNPATVGTSVTITGTNFGATQGGSTVTFNGTTASPATWSATSITVPVPVGATTGNVVVTVGSQPSNGYLFTVTPPAPAITSILPNPATVGTSVTITGTNFGATQGGSTVTFNGTTASPATWSATSITVPVPVGATTGNVVVTVGGQPSNGYLFTVTPPAPTITNILPNPATVGTSVTITGTNFGATQGGSTLTFNGTTASPETWSATSITVPVPVGATTGNVVVTVGGQPSNGYLFTVTPPAPTITNILPNPATVGTSVTITGTNFGATQGGSTLTFNGTTASPETWSATSITANVPVGATTGNVVVTVSSQPSNGYLFTVTIPAPNITNIQPNPATVGTSVTITGTNFGATQGGSTLTFNGTTASPATWSATSITVPVPVGATTGNVVVTVGGQPSNGYLFTVTPPAPTITNILPNPATVGTSVTITGTNFGATQGGSALTFNGTTASPATWSATSITVPVPVGATTGNVVVTVGSQPSNGYPFTVSTGATPADSITWHYDNSRSGLNPNETTLTTANVNSTTFGKVGEYTVDGRIDGQVLYLGQLSIGGQMKNVIYFATENDTVYALDADSISGSSATVLWSRSLVPSGEAPAIEFVSGSPEGDCGNVFPTVGVLGTPVIDRGRNAIYAVAKTMDTASNDQQFFRIHALDLTTGAELFSGPTTITGSYPGTAGNVSGGVVTFSPRDQNNRPGLLETGGNIYVAFGGSFGDCGNYSGFLMSYSADTLAQTGVIDLNPNSIDGGMWDGQAGPSADTAGSVYVVTGNTGDYPTLGANDYPNSVVRLTNSGTLTVADYWTPFDTVALNGADEDLGSAGLLLLPDLVDNASVVHHYAVAAGKDGNMYVVNRDNLGQFNSATNNIVQSFQIAHNQNFSTPAYFNNNVYVSPQGNPIEAFAISNALLATTPTMQTSQVVGAAGFSLSSNGAGNGILWAIFPTSGHGVLYAFDASNLSSELYASNQASGNRDQTAPILGTFHTPTVANGRVYLGTGSTMAVFGLLP